MKKVNFVVTDLDDTIWDWLRMWHDSFEPYLNRISQQFNIDRKILEADFQKIHERYHSTESSFIYQELTCLTQEQKNEFTDESSGKKSIIHEYYSLKKNNLFLQNGVLKTLKTLKEKGVFIIGFTESNSFFTKYRIKHLELDGLFDYIYAPIDMGVPESVYRHYSEDFWEPEMTEIRYLSKDLKKPAPDVLEIILRDFRANKDNTIYIGDKLNKDVFMANVAEVDSIYAKYGDHIDSEKYQLLRDVTHWTKKEVEAEIQFKLSHNETPIAKYTLNNGFDEILSMFDFFEYEVKFNSKNIPTIITIWEKTIDVQQHFNDIELRIRNLALTAFTFIIGGIGYLEKSNLKIKLDDFNVPYSSVLAFIGIFIMSAFYYMDRYWYHRLLNGAVKQALFIEKRLSKKLPEIKLTHKIGETSPHKFLCGKIHSDQKFLIFYGIIGFTILIVGIGLIIANNI